MAVINYPEIPDSSDSMFKSNVKNLIIHDNNYKQLFGNPE